MLDHHASHELTKRVSINGNSERGAGILNNELYIGRLVWNRLRYIRDLSTGKRISRLNDPAKWVEVRCLRRQIFQDQRQPVRLRHVGQQGNVRNRLNISADTLRDHHVRRPEAPTDGARLVQGFATVFIAECNTVAGHQTGKADEAKSELARIKTRPQVLVNAVAEGLSARRVEADMLALEARADEIVSLLAAQLRKALAGIFDPRQQQRQKPSAPRR